MPSETIEIEDLLPPSFSTAYADFMPTSVVCIVEAINPKDGNLHLFAISDDSTPRWKELGMLTSRINDLNAFMTRDILSYNDGSEQGEEL